MGKSDFVSKLKALFGFTEVRIALLTLGFPILLLFQNCSDIKITPHNMSAMPSIIADSSKSQLPIPREINGHARIIIVMDQSFSMVWNKCDTDLDGASPAPQESGFFSCSRTAGVDQPGYRFEVIKKWLDEMDATGTSDGIKVMILPFSGGKALRPHGRDVVSPIHGLKDRDYMKFLSTLDARVWLDALKQEQDAMIQDGSREIMGTTMFSPILEYALAEITNELDLLKEEDQIAVTPFQFVMITDGVYKPTNELLNKVRQVAGCPDCNANPGHIACTCFDHDCWGGSGTPPGSYCSRLESNFKMYFGDPQENELAKVKDVLDRILALQSLQKYSGLRVSMRFSKMNWLAVPKEDLNTTSNKTKNIFDEVQKSLTKKIDVYNISSAEPPFSILASGGSSLSYVIKNIYAINTNAFVDKYGKLVSDSDGDGLSDEEELKKGFDPQKPRTNGICLDYITANYGCQSISCDPTMDKDRDGLNDCEELTLGSFPYLFDSDGDNIPDYYEVIRGLNVNYDESGVYSAGDKYSDHIHFRKGVVNSVKLDSIQGIHKVDLNVEFKGFQTVKDGSSVNAVGVYNITLKNLPVLPSFSIPSHNILDMRSSLTTTIADTHRLDPLSKPAQHNDVVFLMQITTVENPNLTSWHLLKQRVKSTGQQSLQMDFDLRNFIQIQGSAQ